MPYIYITLPLRNSKVSISLFCVTLNKAKQRIIGVTISKAALDIIKTADNGGGQMCSSTLYIFFFFYHFLLIVFESHSHVSNNLSTRGTLLCKLC